LRIGFKGGVPEKLAHHVPGVNLNVAKPTTDLERQMQESGTIPGPGQYGAPMQVREKEGKGGGGAGERGESEAGRQAGGRERTLGTVLHKGGPGCENFFLHLWLHRPRRSPNVDRERQREREREREMRKPVAHG
jgi:hypothetical protein